MTTLVIMLYFIGMLVLFTNRYYLMMILLSIEFMYMSLLLMLCVYFCLFNLLGIFVFLISIVCEAGLALSLLVMMSFYYGNELMLSMNLIKC
uniref:NADH dehydrogenase subunit 4L n=1 Tax=Rhipicephalus sanguineus TaxID=34632 RepID=R4IKL8_RHISA|nr:NADH dehydrogenase subunit 4L [Rhipicephalus linnaei]AFR24939.1 NADH dehydrogenase subunit 4L [Rhipicephalus sanguineus]QTZ18356.1 NADH dehydrogenase subunit 4L [Rhipicephalus linnaei]QTZ18369.1 NADH dehydrogenase subunit 4L [Rhipicephalus linnaei]QTZ18382.1 NADH dehydrogenase subunit 4L [Rhipicephalus linnaei]UNO54427.1 NADH dehydrogenase subunit 4L [Rhipicephalus sanguineus]